MQADEAACVFGPLPLALCCLIFALLPVDSRMRCREVCRAWRDALEERSLWRRLDLSAAGGVAPERVNEPFLRAAVARARGDMEALLLTDCGTHTLECATIEDIAATHARTLRELWLPPVMGTQLREHLLALRRAAPALRELHAFMWTGAYACQVVEARELLSGDPPLEVVVWHDLAIDGRGASAEDWRALAAAMAAHSTLREVVMDIDEDATIPELIDTALAVRLRRLHMSMVHPLSAVAPDLARLLRGGAIEELTIIGPETLMPPDGADAVLEFAAALRASTSLRKLVLSNAGVWHLPEVGVPLLRALTSHATLRSFATGNCWLARNHTAVTDAVCTALGELVAVDAPSLEQLTFSHTSLGAGLRPLLRALPRNTHLRELDITANSIGAGFSLTVLLPAVQSNSSLRKVEVDMPGSPPSGLGAHLAALMAARRRGDA